MAVISQELAESLAAETAARKQQPQAGTGHAMQQVDWRPRAKPSVMTIGERHARGAVITDAARAFFEVLLHILVAALQRRPGLPVPD
jgi:hypothetical protein